MRSSELQDLWQKALDGLQEKVRPEEVTRWLAPLKIVGLEDSPGQESAVVRVAPPNRFFGQWVADHYLAEVGLALGRVLGRLVRLEIDSDSASPPAVQPEVSPVPPAGPIHSLTEINPRYTFDNFIVGDCNRLAHAASLAVANSPGKAYNPLFIYAGAGLGKTHLLNAVANYVAEKNNSRRVAYLTSETFTNQLIQAIQARSMEAFRFKFRTLDVLMIDDIHFLGQKERTQEEFFFTFNALYEQGKQIILTSDQRPKDIPGLEERLCSRFEWGLVADIQAPDQETKEAIISRKASDGGLKLPETIVRLLASSKENNIRVLEGHLVRLAAQASLHGREISLILARQILKESQAKKEVGIDDIIRFICDRYHVRITELRSGNKARKVAEPRQIAMYLARKMTGLPLVQIGQKFGGKDHSTVVHAVKKMEARQDRDADFRREVLSLILALRQM